MAQLVDENFLGIVNSLVRALRTPAGPGPGEFFIEDGICLHGQADIRVVPGIGDGQGRARRTTPGDDVLAVVSCPHSCSIGNLAEGYAVSQI